jgi:hypothetical protein
MEKNKDLELVEFKLDESKGDTLYSVSIVDDPAIEKTFMYFNNIKISNYSVVSDEKMEITGIAMTPNKPILRVKPNGEYYNCWFSEDTIKSCMFNFLSNCNHTTANFNHSDKYTDKVKLLECWIVEDVNNDKLNALKFKDITKGDWAMTYKVIDPELWKEIKTGNFTGFSIEGWFSQFDAINLIDKKTQNIYNIINSNLSDDDKIKLINNIIK